MTRPLLRVFVSSTAIDLVDHRKAVEDVILRVEGLPVMMEAFGALPREPVEVCRSKAREAAAVVVLVAHRYGWVPDAREGGDGHRSITWLEVEAALEAGRQVFAYIVEDAHRTGAAEQDRLLEPDADPVAIKAALDGLRAFKQWIEREARVVRDRFTTPDDLGKRVAIALAGWASGVRPAAESRPAPHVHVAYALQPAPHFRGRQALLADLVDGWWADPAHPDRIRALVALGGTGKTAIAARFVDEIRRRPQRASTLVWSFYEQPDADAFLREAGRLFLGEQDGAPGGRFERLRRGLDDGAPHLLVLDGLERVQAEGGGGRAHGELDDHQLKTLLRTLAGGGLGRTRALVTSRFPLADLSGWEGAGARTVRLNDLDRDAAIGVLRAWGVIGDDEALDGLAVRVGRHALSVSVLGSFLRDFRGGDPAGAPDLDLGRAADEDPRAGRLARILAEVARALPDAERDLLARLSAFPRGIGVAVLGYLVDAGGQVAGTLVGCGHARLAELAQRLVRRGLVFAYDRRGERTYTAHPFLRGYFEGLLGVPSAEVHEAVRAKLAPSLASRPETMPTEPEVLDRYEALIEHSARAGRWEEAFELYWYGVGCLDNLGTVLGDFARALRMLACFGDAADLSTFGVGLDDRTRSLLANEFMNGATDLGELGRAEAVSAADLRFAAGLGEPGQLSIKLLNAAQLAGQRGHLPQAAALARDALRRAEEAGDERLPTYSHAYEARIAHLQGDLPSARQGFAAATRLEGQPLYSGRGIWEARHRTDLGAFADARDQTEANLDTCAQYPWNFLVASCHALLARIALSTDLPAVRPHLEAVLDWTARSGHMELILDAHFIAAEHARLTGDLPAALTEARQGLTLADSCGFGLLAIELLVSLARTHLAIPDPRAALRHARDALDRSRHPDCGYAWGEADALHLCGLAHRALGEPDHARRRFGEAVAVRERIEHPGLADSRRLLAAV